MFFLFSKTILFEIHCSRKQYLIGDKSFDSIPLNIIDNSFNSAYWNRALKFAPANSKQENLVYNYMLDVDFFMHKNKIISVSKNNFFIDILNSSFFVEEFIKIIMKHHFKHTLSTDLKIENEQSFLHRYNFVNKKNILRLTNFNYFLCFDENLEIKDKKFEKIFLVSKKTKNFSWSINSKNQLIYELPLCIDDELVNNSLALDIRREEFLVNFKSNVVDGLIIEGLVTNKKAFEKVINSAKSTIEKSNDEYMNWHLYMLTGSVDFFKKEIESSVNASIRLKQVAKIFKQNYKKLFEFAVFECGIKCEML